jgi:FIMAH domain-containing protein
MNLRPRTLVRSSLACLVAIAASGTMAFGQTTLVFNTSDSRFDVNVNNQGWWSTNFANAGTNNDNHFTGEDVNLNSLFRSFFTFDLSTLVNRTVLSATLELTRYTYVSPDPTETIEFFDVSTDAATVNNNVGIDAAIYEDLGTGVSYGAFVVNSYTPSEADTLTFTLNAAALDDIQAASGGFFSVGGALQSIVAGGSNEGIFSSSGEPRIHRLILETAPSAVTLHGEIDQLVSDGDLTESQAVPLTQLLEQVQDSLDRGSNAAADGQLESFVRQVEALVRSGRLSSSDGQQLIDLAEELGSQLLVAPLGN